MGVMMDMGSGEAWQNAGGGSVPVNVERKDGQRDPALVVPGMAPNFGKDVMSHIFTFQGMISSIAKVYRHSDEALRDSYENARFMRNHLPIMECLDQRRRSVALLDWHLEPDDEKDQRQVDLADNLTRIIEQTKYFVKYRETLLDALWYGRYAVKHRFRWKTIRGQRRVVIDRWQPVHGDKLVWKYDDGTGEYDDERVGIRIGAMFTHNHQMANGVDELGNAKVQMTDWGMAYFLEPWERRMLCIHTHQIEDGEFEEAQHAGRIHGIGIRSRVYWTWYQMQESLAWLMEFLERSAFGIEIWYYPWGNDEARSKTREAAQERIGDGRNIILVPKPMGEEGMAYGVERIEPAMAGAEVLKSILTDYFGHQIKRYILGQTLTTEAGSTGLGSNLASIHLDTYLQIIKYDATNLSETLTSELVDPLKMFNFPDMADVPIKFVIETEAPDVDAKLQAWKSAYEMGCKLKMTDVMDLIGASLPGEDDEALQDPAHLQAAQQMQAQQTQVGYEGQRLEMDQQKQQFEMEQARRQYSLEAQQITDAINSVQVPPPAPEPPGPEDYAIDGTPKAENSDRMPVVEEYAKWKESEHPRDEDGKWTDEGGENKPQDREVKPSDFIGQAVYWETVNGTRHAGVVADTDSNVLIVRMPNGDTETVEDAKVLPLGYAKEETPELLWALSMTPDEWSESMYSDYPAPHPVLQKAEAKRIHGKTLSDWVLKGMQLPEFLTKAYPHLDMPSMQAMGKELADKMTASKNAKAALKAAKQKRLKELDDLLGGDKKARAEHDKRAIGLSLPEYLRERGLPEAQIGKIVNAKESARGRRTDDSGSTVKVPESWYVPHYEAVANAVRAGKKLPMKVLQDYPSLREPPDKKDYAAGEKPPHYESQLQKGIRHEHEHTSNPAIAEKIARDHLKEDPKYYDHLEEMQRKHPPREIRGYTTDQQHYAKPGEPARPLKAPSIAAPAKAPKPQAPAAAQKPPQAPTAPGQPPAAAREKAEPAAHGPVDPEHPRAPSPNGATIHGKFYTPGQWIPKEELAQASPQERAAIGLPPAEAGQNTEGKVIGKGSTGNVVQRGDRVYKTLRGEEGNIYKALRGVEGVASGQQEGNSVSTPAFRYVISRDAVHEKSRRGMSPLIKPNMTRLVNALTALSEAGYYYNDPIQIGLDESKAAHLFDFSNAEKMDPERAAFDNLPLLKNFLDEFGLPRYAAGVSAVSDIKPYADDEVFRDFVGDDPDAAAGASISRALGAPSKYGYFTFDRREIPGVPQVWSDQHQCKVVLTTTPLDKQLMYQYDLVPVIHRTDARQDAPQAAPAHFSLSQSRMVEQFMKAYYHATGPEEFDQWMQSQEDGERVLIQDGVPMRYSRKRGNFSVERYTKAWKESEHPRDDEGKWVDEDGKNKPAKKEPDNQGKDGGQPAVEGPAKEPGQKRAKAGGEIGPNGEWYPGGAFIATTDMPKKTRERLTKAASGKREVEPWKWEVPEPGRMPIYDTLGPGTSLDPRSLELNYDYLMGYQRQPEAIIKQYEDLLQKYQDGERYVAVEDYPELAKWKDMASMVVAGMTVPGALLEKMASAHNQTVEEWQSGLGLRKYQPSKEK